MRSVVTYGRLLLFLSLLNCAGVGVKASSNPQTKIKDAYSLMGVGRYPLARKLLNEALEFYIKNNNDLGQAQAHSALGDVNRDGKGSSMPDYSRSIGHYRAAAVIYKKRNEPKWVAFNLYAIAGVQSLQGKKEEACATLKKSKAIYASAPNFDQASESFEKGAAFSFKSYPEAQLYFGCQF